MTYFKKEKEIKKYADKLLSKIDPESSFDIYDYENENPFKSKYGADLMDVIKFLEEEKGYVTIESCHPLIYKNGNKPWGISEPPQFNILRITKEGTEVNRKGGILKKERAIRNEKCVQKIKDRIGIIGTLVGITGGLLGVSTFFSNKSVHDETKKEADSLKNEINIINERQLELNTEINKHIDSLYSKIKTLEK